MTGSGRPVVTVVGLGPAGPELVTSGTAAAIAAHAQCHLRTRRHPAASVVGDAPSFDHVYDEAETISDVYHRIVELLVESAVRHRSILYAVPGSPVVAERSVELLLADPRVDVVVFPALSFVDLAWVRLGIDPVSAGVRIVDGHRFEVEAAGERGPLLVAQCDSLDVLSDVKLAIGDAIDTRSSLGSGLARRTGDGRGPGLVDDDLVVRVIQRLGLDGEQIFDVGWADLDRSVVPDHLTSLWIPQHVAPVAVEVQRFAELVGTLRRECPWDREQTHESLRRHLLEEAYEVLDAIDNLDVEAAEGYDHLEEELGDLLFQIVFHSTLAAEAGQFTLADVARTVHDKLFTRHPHVFGGVDAEDARQVAANWEQIKKAEKGRTSVFDGVPDALPSLLFALKVQKKARSLELGSTAGEGVAGRDDIELDWADELPMLVERAMSAPGVDGVGALLFAVVDLARRADIDPETALRSFAAARRDAIKSIEHDTRPVERQ